MKSLKRKSSAIKAQMSNVNVFKCVYGCLGLTFRLCCPEHLEQHHAIATIHDDHKLLRLMNFENDIVIYPRQPIYFQRSKFERQLGQLKFQEKQHKRRQTDEHHKHFHNDIFKWITTHMQ